MPLSFLERKAFEQSLYHPWLMENVMRPYMYTANGNDAEAVHDYVIDLLADDKGVLDTLKANEKFFEAQDELNISVNGRKVAPFGTAAGLDKNGDAMLALSYVFGFQEPGTIVVNPREGNAKPRVAVDDCGNIYNAQGFPSRGFEYFKKKLVGLREKRGGDPVVYASICGLPTSGCNALDVAMTEMKQLVTALEHYVDGFVWDPYSPNTEALNVLRTKETFEETSGLIRRHAPGKLRLVKMGPYEGDIDRREFLSLVGGFVDGGGNGIVAVNTRTLPRDMIPSDVWGYKSAGVSGRLLRRCRLQAVGDTREAFPELVIVATGGIFDGRDAYDTFKAGATMLEGYTPYIYHGLGLLPRIESAVSGMLKKDGYESLEQLQSGKR